MRRLFLARPVWITFLALAAMGANAAWQTLQGHAKLETSGLAKVDAPRNVAVELSVAPEQFHMSRLQQWGTMVGAVARTVSLRNVSPSNLATIASQSWVAAIRRLEP